MGCCCTQPFEEHVEVAELVSVKAIDMQFVHEHLKLPTASADFIGTPVSDRGDSSVTISRTKFVTRFDGEVTQYYRIESKLGSGSYGTVYRAAHLASGCLRAIKSIPKSRVNSSKQHELYREVEILKQMDHPNIIKIQEVIDSPKDIHIVTELCTGGNLFSRVSQLPVFTESMAAKYMIQVVRALLYCHKNSIVHRDLKPENILFESADENASLKVIDFGISTKIQANTPLDKFIGTVYYVAPEVIKGQYNEKCDIWSCGVILFALLSGRPPFMGKSKPEILSSISRGLFTFQAPSWTSVSTSAKNLIRSMLQTDPARRPSAQELHSHPWFQQRVNDRIEDNQLSRQILETLASYQGTWKIREATFSYIVHHLVTPEEVANLRQIFVSLDENGDGTLDREELLNGFNRLQLRHKYDINSIILNCDFNNNGEVDYSEFLTATIKWKKALTEERLQIAFQAYDTDKNGKISLNEVKAFIGDETIEDEIWMEMFKEADLNKDGFIDYAEFRRIMNGFLKWPSSDATVTQPTTF